MSLDNVLPLPESWLSIDEAARDAGVSHREIYAAIISRQLPAVTDHPGLPGVWLVARRELNSWMEGSASGGPQSGEQAKDRP